MGLLYNFISEFILLMLKATSAKEEDVSDTLISNICSDIKKSFSISNSGFNSSIEPHYEGKLKLLAPEGGFKSTDARRLLLKSGYFDNQYTAPSPVSILSATPDLIMMP